MEETFRSLTQPIGLTRVEKSVWEDQGERMFDPDES